MELLKIILYINSLIWFLIPIRQYKTRFFSFFLVLALFDPIVIILYQFLTFKSLNLYLIGTVILLYPALFGVTKKIKISILLLFCIASLITIYFSLFDLILIQIAIHLIIFIYFLKLFVIHFSESRQILLFHLFLLGYEFSILLKFIVYYNEVALGQIYFYGTTAVEILIGLFFIFVNEKNSPAIKV